MVWEGYVPAILKQMPTDLALGFIRVDLDHYQPTLDAGIWAWERLLPNGYLTFHDFMPNRNTPKLASAAVLELMRGVLKDAKLLVVEEKEAIFQKAV